MRKKGKIGNLLNLLVTNFYPGGKKKSKGQKHPPGKVRGKEGPSKDPDVHGRFQKVQENFALPSLYFLFFCGKPISWPGRKAVMPKKHRRDKNSSLSPDLFPAERGGPIRRSAGCHYNGITLFLRKNGLPARSKK
jgi:hypothetical protein